MIIQIILMCFLCLICGLKSLLSHPENHLRAVRKKPCCGGGSPTAVFASAPKLVKNCAAIIFAVPWIIRWPTLAIVPPT